MEKFISYGKQFIDKEDIAAVVDVLKGDWLTTGPLTEKFEKEVAKYCGVDFAVAVSSGTAALDIAIQTLNLPKGSEIITTPLTFIATINSILFNNLNPVLADIDSKTYNLSPESIRSKITEKTKAILYVDYAGQPCNIDQIKEIAKENNLFIIEDAAQAFGAEYNGQKIGGFADMTIFSFHPVKHITTGEGGMVLTNNAEYFKKLRCLRNHGINKELLERLGPQADWGYDITDLARNYRITDVQCALGLSQLKKSEDFLQRREQIAQKYFDELKDITEITLPYIQKNLRTSWHLFPILINNYNRDIFFRKMKEKKIGVNIHHIPPYRFTYHQRFGWKAEDLPITEKIFQSTITLPIHPSLSINEQEYIIKTVKEILSNK